MASAKKGGVLRGKILERIEKREPEKKSVTLFLGRENYERLQERCEARNAAVRKAKTGKLVKASEIIDELIAMYLANEL
jgi:hypothetical protein